MSGVFTGLHYAFATSTQRQRKIDMWSAFAAVRFPAYSYIVLNYMYQGIVYSGFRLLYQTVSDFSLAAVTCGLIGAVFAIAFPVLSRRTIQTYARVSFVKYWQFKKKSNWTRWLFPHGYWFPIAQRQVFGSMFGNQKGKFMLWGVVPASVTGVCNPHCHL